MEVLFGIQKQIAQTNLSYELMMFAQHLKRKQRIQVAKLLGSMFKLDFLSYIFHCHVTLPLPIHYKIVKKLQYRFSDPQHYICQF